MSRTITWTNVAAGPCVRMLDQQALPLEVKFVDATTVQSVYDCIKDMTIRGAPAIGAAGAYGMALAAFESKASSLQDAMKYLKKSKDHLDSSRPTAVNLVWATTRMMEVATKICEVKQVSITVAQLCDSLLEEAHAIAQDDIAINRRIGHHGSQVIKEGSNLLHHCNTGSLATVDHGTAIGIIYTCHEQKKNIHVWVDETRPRLQGARLSAFELMERGVPMHLIADNAAGHLMRTGKVDAVVFGADRVAANGDVANKVGTYKLAVVAKENGIPVYAAVPTSTLDLTLKDGNGIPIEERSAEEVTMVGKERIAPHDVPVFNPAFDVTPNKYLTGIVTEEGICYPPFDVSLSKAKEAAESSARKTQDARIAELIKKLQS